MKTSDHEYKMLREIEECVRELEAMGYRFKVEASSPRRSNTQMYFNGAYFEWMNQTPVRPEWD